MTRQSIIFCRNIQRIFFSRVFSDGLAVARSTTRMSGWPVAVPPHIAESLWLSRTHTDLNLCLRLRLKHSEEAEPLRELIRLAGKPEAYRCGERHSRWPRVWWIIVSQRFRRIMTSLPMADTKEIEIPLPDGGTLTLRPVTAGDEEFLLSVYASTRADELGQAVWQEGQQDTFVKWQFDLQRREYDARFPDAQYNLILIDNNPAGRIWTGSDDEQIRLLDIALLPEFQNRGAGTLLLRRLISESERAGKPLRHMVFMLNSDAHRFYERLGFKIIEDLGAYRHMEWRPGLGS